MTAEPVQVRFTNNGGKKYARAEAHLVYRTKTTDVTKVTFAWEDDGGAKKVAHRCSTSLGETDWTLETGTNVRTEWVEFEPVN